MVGKRDLGPCCVSLLAALGNRVILPGSSDFSDSLSGYYSQQESTIQPQCIVRPESTAEVSSALKTLSRVSKNLTRSADKAQCRVAVRSGGHGINAGAANIQNGVTIDLSYLNSTTVSNKKVASIGVGAAWDQVYAQLDPIGLSVAGGRNAGVGVGGLTTGGGISFFSPRYGWTCDTVVNYEVVLADGSIVNANERTNPDLLFALRGGSNNFGVVTRVDLQAFDQGKLWGGMSYYDLSTIDAHVDAFVNFAAADNYDDFSSLVFTYVLFNGQPPLLATALEYTKPEENPPSARPITSIPAILSTLRVASMAELAVELAALQPYGLRQLYVQVTHKATAPMIRATYDRWRESVPGVQDVPGIAFALSLEPLPPSIFARAAGGNALGLETRSESLVVSLLTVTWADAADDARVTAAARTLIDNIASDARRLGAYDPFVYLNYAAPWQKPVDSYGSKNVARLRKIQRAYDPTGFFTKNVPGGFKIPA
ncbi:putative oxidoreductase [Durotheca rogersii]|uniref:putative oxidoreductase n=1 Tax=Durotheca rogersii TaxID=419775 RepID=UPI002220EE1B|nr:putative oxidoreductase [Durotheca rogersii]KAI5857352.1 putative oxidoreductase [Durotheca rogersii]